MDYNTLKSISVLCRSLISFPPDSLQIVPCLFFLSFFSSLLLVHLWIHFFLFLLTSFFFLKEQMVCSVTWMEPNLLLCRNTFILVSFFFFFLPHTVSSSSLSPSWIISCLPPSLSLLTLSEMSFIAFVFHFSLVFVLAPPSPPPQHHVSLFIIDSIIIMIVTNCAHLFFSWCWFFFKWLQKKFKI